VLVNGKIIIMKWFVFGGIFRHGDFQEMEPNTGFCVGPFDNKQHAERIEFALIRKNIDICWYKTWIADVTVKDV
tara:strand:- start:3126 stop:3347 length:222 start_codon:yes stop_codon:yes gene_type:complete